MQLDIIYGKPRNPLATRRLVEALQRIPDLAGTLYIGYPILSSADNCIPIDALLTSTGVGLVVFHIPEDAELQAGETAALGESQDKLYFALEASLGRHEALRSRRALGVNINVISFVPDVAALGDVPPETQIADAGSLPEALGRCEPTDTRFLPALNAALQRVTTIKPTKKRANAVTAHSRGSKLKAIEKEIANLDQWQKQAAIETPEGPQRVRGLAGSGKTVVLALKAAYLHALHPDWQIAVTFHTRSLYQQFRDLIRRFSFEHTNDEPNWDKLQVLHSWGSRSQPGLYSEIAAAIDHPIRDFGYGATAFGRKDAFDGVCKEILPRLHARAFAKPYQAVLIDEAQDLPPSFFQMVYAVLDAQKRVVWAYDELQNLTDHAVPSIDTLFGTNQAGAPIVSLANPENGAHQDIVLPVCYRNTPWALTVAHALGFGLCRSDGFVQYFDEDELWTDIGYELDWGDLVPGRPVRLKRGESSYPAFFQRLLTPTDSVQCHAFGTFEEETNWIADQIATNLRQDELDPDDILVVLPNAWTAKTQANDIGAALRSRDIRSHLAGVSSSRDELYLPDSVAIANIYRAKGNEAPMVYVANSNYCAEGLELAKLRNSLFTAITRSRAWVRVTGYGDQMNALKREFDSVVGAGFVLSFTVPTLLERQRLRVLHRERTASERERIRRAQEGLERFLALMDEDEIDLSALPAHLRERLQRHLGGEA